MEINLNLDYIISKNLSEFFASLYSLAICFQIGPTFPVPTGEPFKVVMGSISRVELVAQISSELDSQSDLNFVSRLNLI